MFDFEDFAKAVHIAVYCLNDVLIEGIYKHPLQEQRDCAKDWKQIGLGIMGLADMLIKMRLTYGSKKAVELCDRIGRTLASFAISASQDYAISHCAYEKFNDKVFETEFYKEHSVSLRNRPLANSQLLTIAPTGTISTMIGVSGGIEPIFANSYTRKTISLHGHDKFYKVYTPIVEEYMKVHDITEEKDLPSFFVTSSDIPIEERIEMQSIWQKHIDASISSTINMPKEATVEDVEKLYMLAWEKGLKGITMYRNGCAREGILITDNSSTTTDEAKIDSLPWGTVLESDDDLLGIKRKIINGCGKFHLQLFFDETDGSPRETFISMGRGGGCERNLTFISQLISLCLRAGVPISEVIEAGKKGKPCKSFCDKKDTSKGTSCPTALAYALEDLMEKFNKNFFVEETENKIIETPTITNNSSTCPECGSDLEHEGGCVVCKNCGWSKCN